VQVYDSWDGFRERLDWSPVIGVHDPPGREVRDGLLDHVTKIIDLRVVLLLPIQERSREGGTAWGLHPIAGVVEQGSGVFRECLLLS
jgi:hypothetical protein